MIYSTHQILRVNKIKSRTVKCVGHVVCMGGGQPERKRAIRKTGLNGRIILKWIFFIVHYFTYFYLLTAGTLTVYH